MAELDYAKVIGRFGITVIDSADGGDDPDTIWCDEGSIRLTPLITYTKFQTATPVPATLGQSVIDATVDDQGYLSWNGLRYVKVVDLTSEKLNPRISDGKATHRVEFRNVKAAGTVVAFETQNVRIVSGVDNDLTVLLPVPIGQGTPIVVGPTGVGIEDASITGPGHLQLELTSGDLIDAGELPVGPGGSDAGVASYLANPTSLTAIQQAATLSTALAGVGRPSWDAIFAAPATADVSTITFASAATLTGTTFTPARDAGVPRYDFDPAFRYNGCSAVMAVDATAITAAAGPGGSSMRLHPEMVTSRGVDVYEVRVRATAVDAGIREVAEDRWSGSTLTRTTATIGQDYYIRVAKPTARSRFIRIELSGFDFISVTVPTGETLTNPGGFDQTIVGCADSFGGGANLPPDGASRLETAIHRLAFAINSRARFINLSIGGTGWVWSDTPYTLRIPGIVSIAPDLVLAFGSRNDQKVYDPLDPTHTPVTPAMIYTAARDGMAALIAAGAVVLASGPAQSPFASTNAAVRDAAIEAGAIWVDTLDVITPALTGPDGVHPTLVGHEDLGEAYWDRSPYATLMARLTAIPRGSIDTALNVTPAVQASDVATVTLAATVDPPILGRVDFYDSLTKIGSAALVSGAASMTTDALPRGTHQLIARTKPANASRYQVGSSLAEPYLITAPMLPDIITTNLLAEIAVDALTGLSSGAAIASLTPPRGSRTETIVNGATKPTYYTDEDGYPCIRSAVSGAALGPTAWASTPTSPLTLFMVYRIVSLGGSYYLLQMGTSSAARLRLTVSGAGTRSITVNALTPTTMPSTPAFSTGWMVECYVMDGSNITPYYSSVIPGASRALATTVSLGGAGALGWPGGSVGNDVRLRALLPYSGIMSSDDVTAMMLYLGNKYHATVATS